MPQTAYQFGEALRELQPVSVPAFTPEDSPAEILKVPEGFILRLVALGVNYELDVGQEVTREVFLQIVDPNGVNIIPSDASAALSTAGFAPSPDTELGFGVGFFGAQSGAGDNLTFQTITLGILDIALPAAYKYQLRQTGFAGSDKVVSTSCLVELIEAVDSSTSLPPGFGDKSTLATLLNTP